MTPKNRHLRTITQLCRAMSSQLRHVSTIGKNLLNSSISSKCPRNMVNFGPLTHEIGWRFWGTPANVNGFRFLASSLQRRHSLKANETLQDVWPSAGLVHYIYIFGGSGPQQYFASCKIHFVFKSCALLYCQRYCTAFDQRPSAKLCGVVQGMELWNLAEGATYIRLSGYHVGPRLTF